MLCYADRDRVVRRGLALIIESDFYATDAGRQHFADQLTSIRYCVQETCNFDTLYAYLTTSNYDFNYGDAHRLQPPPPTPRLNARPWRPQTAPKTCAPSATSRRR